MSFDFVQACERVGFTPRELLSNPYRAPFKDAYATFFMEVIHRAFWAKAEGGVDDFGGTWEPLKESTIEIKKQIAEGIPGFEGEYQKIRSDGSKNGMIHFDITTAPQIKGIYTHRQYLSPKQLQTYRQRAVGKHHSTRNNRGLAAVQHGTDLDKAELINIRSGRLAAALAPVTASRGRLYQSNPDSSYYWADDGIRPILRIDIRVPYADEIDQGGEGRPPRRILPPKMIRDNTINEMAVEEGLKAAKRIKDIEEVPF